MGPDLEISSLSGVAEQDKDECSKTFQHNHDTDNDESDDAFFEDISSSLINIRQHKVNVATDTKQKQLSIISNPLENTLLCVHDLSFNSHFAKRKKEELSHQNSDRNEVINVPNQHSNGSWRVINVTNEDFIQEITQEEEGNQGLDSSADSHLESSYQRQHITTMRRVYRGCTSSQTSYLSTSTPARIAVSESSDISSDFRMSISVFESGNSELEHDSGSVFDEEELVTTESERFFINQNY